MTLDQDPKDHEHDSFAAFKSGRFDRFLLRAAVGLILIGCGAVSYIIWGMG